MRNVFISLVIVFAYFALFGCSPPPQDKALAKIGNTSLYTSDAEFLAAIRAEPARNKEALVADLQQVAETRRMAETARKLYAGEQTSIQKNIADNEDARLAQIYSYFYVQANMGHTNNALMDYYKKHKTRYADSSFSPFISLREKLAADLFLEENPQLAATVNDSNKAFVIDSVRRALASSEGERLKKLYNINIVEIEPPGLEDYYKNNPEEFQTKTAYKLLSLSNADSTALANKIKGISTREGFAKIATEMPIVKQGHAIMDIGMFHALDAEVATLGAKKFTQILRAPDTQVFYVFYIDSIIAPQLKSWDRSKELAKSIMDGKGDFPLDSSTVLAKINDAPFITEKDILEEMERIHPMRRAMFRRAAVLANLIEKRAYARAAREKKLDKSPEYLAWTRQLTDQAYAQILMDSLLTTTLGIPEQTLKDAYEAEKDSLFLPRSFEESKLDVAVWLSIPDISYRREFILNKQSYGDGEASSWKAIRRSAYKNIRYREFSGVQERVLSELQKSIPVKVLDDSWGLEFTPSNFTEIAELAKKQYEARNLQKARTLWEKARALFPQNDSLQKAVGFELANIYQELGMYGTAVDEYKVITKLWPDESDVYKAYFMQGFVLNEYEKKDSLALTVFEEMLEKFPNSDLSDDARVMVENIKSGGKVLEDLIKKIESASDKEE